MAKKTTAVAKLSTGGVPVQLFKGLFNDYINEQAEAAKSAPSGVLRLSTMGGEFKIGDRVFGKEIDVIPLSSVFLNTFYKGKFQAGENRTPDCFAIGRKFDELVPHPNSPAIQGGRVDGTIPEGKTRSCASCWANEWGSGPVGVSGKAGKACQNRNRIEIIHPEELGLVMEGKIATVVQFDTPVTSSREWVKLMDALTSGKAYGEKVPTFAITMHMSIRTKGGAWEILYSIKEGSTAEKALIMKLGELARTAAEDSLKPWPPGGGSGDTGTTRRASSGKTYVKPKHRARKSA